MRQRAPQNLKHNLENQKMELRKVVRFMATDFTHIMSYPGVVFKISTTNHNGHWPQY